MNKKIALIVAVDEVGGFGKEGKIPWHFPEDLSFFKKQTSGNVCVMGRKTYQDLLNYRKKDNKPIDKILPNRESFVVTRNSNFNAPGATVVRSVREALDSLDFQDNRNIYLIGGEKIYISGLSLADKIYMTLIPGNYNCDRHFPIRAMVKKFKLINGKKEGELKFLTYKRM
jgi:dihydrofolate reductase